jgi:enoyl-CoA hydratase/carnithine racemase
VEDSSLIRSLCVDLISRHDIGIISINNGAKNLINFPEIIKFDDLRGWIDSNQFKAVLICGNKRNFSYGADTTLIESSKSSLNELADNLYKGKKVLDYIDHLPLLTVAAINGACFGAGFEIALSCKIRICNKHAFFGLPEANRGLIPGLNGAERLTKLVGKARAAEICLSGKFITADEALNMNIVSKVSDNADCIDDVVDYINDLISDKTRIQVANIMKSINTCDDLLSEDKKTFFTDTL